ncbi:MAG: GAF domain-containing protein [Chloroflexi bacterium]|nr:GAF domain-containing protein [Chloroflexota bacterium]
MADGLIGCAEARVAGWVAATVKAAEAAAKVAEAGERAERAAGLAQGVARVATALARERGLDRVIAVVLGESMDTLGAHVASVYLADLERRELKLVGSAGLPPDLLDRLERVPMDAPSLAARAAGTRQTQIATDADLDPSFALAREVLARTGCGSIVSAPLTAFGELVGVLTYVRPEPSGFTPEEATAVRAIAEVLALSVAHARADETERRQRARLEAIGQAALAISEELFLPLVLQTIAQQARRVASAQYAALSIAVHLAQPSDAWVCDGMEDEQVRAIGAYPGFFGLLGAVVAEGRSIRLRDVKEDQRFGGLPPGHPEITSLLGVPIVYQGQLIGNLFLANKTGAEEFGEEDQWAIEILALHAALAVQHARAYEGMIREIGERKRAETALRESEERFRLLAEHAQDIIYRYRLAPPRGFEYINPVVTQVVGYTPAEHYADPDLAFKLVHPDDRHLLQAMARGQVVPHPVMLRWLRKDGQTIWTEQHNVPIYDEAGHLIAVEGIARDVTERKRLEEDELAGILDSITDAFVALDREGRFTYVNPRAEQILQRPREELIGRNAWTELPEAVSLPASAELRRAAAEQVTAEGEVFYAPLGVWLEIHAYPARDGVCVYFRDVTERRRAAEEHAQLIREQAGRAAAEAAQRRFAFLAEASALLASSLDYEKTLAQVVRLAVPTFADRCIVNIFDEDGTYRQVEAAHVDPRKAELLRELRRRYPLGPGQTHPAVRALETGRPVFYPELTESVQREIAQDEEHFRLIREIASRSVMWVPLVARGRTLGVISFGMGESGRRYEPADLALAEEIAGRCALAVDNARLYREARDAVRLRDHVLSSISHDLKNPLTLVKGYAQFLMRQATRASPADTAGLVLDGLRRIDETATRMSELVDELLSVAHLQVGQQLALNRQPTDLVALAAKVATRYRQGKTHRIAVDAVVPQLVGAWDPGRLERVLDNLLSNAVKYSPGGGDVTVRIADEESAAGRWAVIEVRDQGLGIPAADQPRIFEPFYRGRSASSQIPGTGLGLPVVRQIVERHGGTVAVESAEGAGTTFTVRLPVAPPNETPGRTAGTRRNS